MIIVDADCHISPTFENGNSLTIEELITRMDDANVQQAITWVQPPYLRNRIIEGNKYVYKATQTYPNRILGFGWADPRLGVDHAIELVKRCIEEYGFFGVKLNGAQNEFPIDDEIISLPVIEEIAKLGSRIAFHIGADSYNNTHPFRLAKIADRFPSTTILAIHMGGASFNDLSSAMIEVAEKYHNILLIGSAIRSVPIINAVERLGSTRICFGSDTPFELMNVEVNKYFSIFNNRISEKDLSLIMGKNILKEFNLIS